MTTEQLRRKTDLMELDYEGRITAEEYAELVSLQEQEEAYNLALAQLIYDS